MNLTDKTAPCPEILAPAGNRESFLAALAAEADAIYCGLKHFSARMEAKNFSIEELSLLTRLAHSKGVRVYVTLNTLVKNNEVDRVGNMIRLLDKQVKPDAIIVQDIAVIELAKQVRFSGEIHLSTLANVSFPSALKMVHEKLGFHRVVVPRELNIDEIKAMASACPAGAGLEVFIHGALCFGVSGRCYWSSYMGGKSGLRGKCVQPCRRRYTQKANTERYYSCQDLSLDVLVKVLHSIPEVKAWKIEGRKKGPHYVYYTVRAYQMLRDHGSDPKKKKAALEMLSLALGRQGTHYNFLPQRPQNPVNIDGRTGSGFFMGNLKGSKQKPYLIPREELLSGDLLRIGYEDDTGHSINRVGKYVPKQGRMFLKPSTGKGMLKGLPVFLIDRREQALKEMISGLEAELSGIQLPEKTVATYHVKRSMNKKRIIHPVDVDVYRDPGKMGKNDGTGFWLPSGKQTRFSGEIRPGSWIWLPPVIWPDTEKNLKRHIRSVLKKGCRNFVLNAPWQIELFSGLKKMNLWAGPFCNIANVFAMDGIKLMGFSGVVVSPELGREDLTDLAQQSPLPLGIIISGHWPLCVSRFLSESMKVDKPFTSPRGEQAWAKKNGSEYWIFPNWQIDLKKKKRELAKAGYSMFVNLIEPVPRNVKIKKRPGLWNWELGLK